MSQRKLIWYFSVNVLILWLLTSIIWGAIEGQYKINPHWSYSYDLLPEPDIAKNLINERSTASGSAFGLGELVHKRYETPPRMINDFQMGGTVEIYDRRCQDKMDKDTSPPEQSGSSPNVGVDIITAPYPRPPHPDCVRYKYTSHVYSSKKFYFDTKLTPNFRKFFQEYPIFNSILLSVFLILFISGIFWSRIKSLLS